MSGRGGARPGAGRKTKTIELAKQLKNNTNEMVKQKISLLQQIHDPELIQSYTRVLKGMLNSEKAGERRDAVKIITDIILKTETPEEPTDQETKQETAEILINKLRAERSARQGSSAILDDGDYDSTEHIYPEVSDGQSASGLLGGDDPKAT